MAYPIDRKIIIGGKTVRVRANTEQEYAEKVVQLWCIPTVRTDQPEMKATHDFEQYALNWYETFSKPNIERSTAATYHRQLRLYWIPAFKGKAVEEITAADIQAVFNGMTNSARETKVKARMVLNMVFEQALEDELITRNPVVAKSIRLTGKSSKVTEPYSLDQMRHIAAHLDDVHLATDRAFLALMALHPLRLEEALGLRYEDVDKEAGVIHIRRSVTHPTRNLPEVKATKTEASARDISFAAPAGRFIPEGKAGEYIIGGGTPYSYTQVRHMCERIRKDIGFDEPITPRRFRTTVLTDLYDTTKDIKQAQAAAGHTTAAMTLKHYVKGRKTSADTAAPVASLYGLG